VLERLVRRHGEGVFEKEYELGKLAFYRALGEGVRGRMMGLAIPLPRKGVRVADGEVEELLGEVLKEEGLQMGDLVIRGLKSTYFGRGERAAVMVPLEARVEGVGEDELNRGRRKATVCFELPKGSYATILVKRIFH
jgi:tRNA pseudouridine13 synthase